MKKITTVRVKGIRNEAISKIVQLIGHWKTMTKRSDLKLIKEGREKALVGSFSSIKDDV